MLKNSALKKVLPFFEKSLASLPRFYLFDSNQTNTAPLTSGLQSDGYPNSAIPKSAEFNELLNDITQRLQILETGSLVINNVAFATAVNQGDLVYWDNVNSWFDRALAGVTLTNSVLGIADLTESTNLRVFLSGLMPAPYAPTGLFPGAQYYLSPLAPGQSIPVVPGAYATHVFTALTAESVIINIAPRADGVPPGTSIDFRGSDVPAGYLAEDGTAYSRAAYANLFDAIGTLYGVGDGSTTFNVPDSRRRVSVGSGGTGTETLPNTTGSTGGAETVSLTADQNGLHVHKPPNGGNGQFNYSNSSAPIHLFEPTASGPDVQGSNETGPSGLGLPHNNIQPSLVVTKCIKF